MTVLAGVLGAVLGAAAGAAGRVLLGRLRRGTRVGPPGCELAVAVLWAAVGAGWAAGVLPGRWTPVLLGLAWFGVTAGLVDLRHRRLPDALTLPAVPVALVLVVPLGAAAVATAAVAGAVAAGVHAVVHLVAPAALGFGDVKLAGSLGAVLGAVSWAALPVAAGLASALTVALALGLGRGRDGIPHGPSMFLATAVLVVAGAAGAG